MDILRRSRERLILGIVSLFKGATHFVELAIWIVIAVAAVENKRTKDERHGRKSLINLAFRYPSCERHIRIGKNKGLDIEKRIREVSKYFIKHSGILPHST
jgi:hypothetical protein